MEGHAVDSVVKSALEKHGPLRKPLRDDLGVDDRRALIELLMSKLPTDRAISLLPLRLRNALGKANKEELEAAAAASAAQGGDGKKGFKEDPAAKYSPWRKYLKKAG